MTAVTVNAVLRSGLETGVPTALFDSHLVLSGNAANSVFQYDVTADGKRFVVVQSAGSASPPTLTAVVNWSADLKK
jgi:hypothetical protein